MIEYVPSVSLARVLAEHRTIHRFLLLHNEDPEGAARRPTAAPPRPGRLRLCIHTPSFTWQRAIHVAASRPRAASHRLFYD